MATGKQIGTRKRHIAATCFRLGDADSSPGKPERKLAVPGRPTGNVHGPDQPVPGRRGGWSWTGSMFWSTFLPLCSRVSTREQRSVTSPHRPTDHSTSRRLMPESDIRCLSFCFSQATNSQQDLKAAFSFFIHRFTIFTQNNLLWDRRSLAVRKDSASNQGRSKTCEGAFILKISWSN